MRYRARSGQIRRPQRANIAWIQDTFERAKFNHTAGVMLISQADPEFDLTDGFHEFLSALRAAVIDYRRPVVYVHGDSHYFRIDKPFQDAQGRRLENFTRLETFGDNQANGNTDVNWGKILIDTNSRDVFAFQPQIVPANRTAVPAR